jgi:hypothetical protein
VVADDEGDHEGAARVLEPGQRDLRPQPRRDRVREDLAPDRPPVGQVAVEAGDAQDAPLAGDDADEPLADRHLRADARLAVAPAAQPHEAAARLVGDEEHGVPEAEPRVQGLEHGVEEGGEVGGPVDPLGEPLQPPQLGASTLEGEAVVRPRGGVPGEKAADVLDALDLEHVGGAQLEDARHPRVRGDRLDAEGHGVEERPSRLRAQEKEAQAEGLEGDGVVDLHRRPGVRVEVARRLVEELAAEGDVAPIHVVDLADEGDVRNALGVGRGEDAGDDASSRASRTPRARPLSCTLEWVAGSGETTATRPLLAMLATVSAAVATGR